MSEPASTTFVCNAWYVAATTDELTDRPVARRILGVPVFLYRDNANRAVAMLDRCPHRRFPMSQGILEPDGVRCGYHGLKFGHDGRCLDVPAQPDRCASLRIRTFETVELGDWIWLWMGDGPSEGRLPPQAPEFEESGRWRRRQICVHHVKARASLFHDNLLDLSHLSFLHAGNIGGSNVATTRPDMTSTDFGLSVRRSVLDPEMRHLPLGKALNITGTVVRVMHQQFYIPSLHITGSAFFAATDAGDSGPEIGSFRVLHALTPETETTMHYFQAYQRNFLIEDVATDAVMEKVLNLPIPEDVFAAEAIERELSFAGEGIEPEEHIISDMVGLRGRLLMERALRAEQDCAAEVAEVRAHDCS